MDIIERLKKLFGIGCENGGHAWTGLNDSETEPQN
jgi:hypothetical protein